MKENGCTIQPIVEKIRGFIPFSNSISPKVNAIAQIEFETAYTDVAFPLMRNGKFPET